MFSVNTNAGAFAALQNLNTTSRALDTTQSRINTGLKVSSARDDSAAYAIAQTMRGDVAGYKAVNQSLNRAISETDVALAAGEATSDLLIEMRELAVAGKDAELDASSRTAMNDKFTQLRDQISSIINNASFNGRNIVDGTDSVTALIDASGDTAITTAANDITLSALSLDTTNLISIPGVSVSGTVVAAASQSLDAGSDSDFRNALVNLENDNGGNLGGENVNPTTGVTSNNDSQSFDTDYVDGVFSALGVANQYSSARLDGAAQAFTISFTASSTIYLVRDGASSYLSNGDPTAGSGSAATPEASVDALTNIEAALTTVNDVLSDLGSTANRLAIQQQFTGRLSDGIEVGIGNLVDADMAKESAQLQSLQTKQQLGLQALGIANQAPQTVLSLFR